MILVGILYCVFFSLFIYWYFNKKFQKLTNEYKELNNSISVKMNASEKTLKNRIETINKNTQDHLVKQNEKILTKVSKFIDDMNKPII